MFVWRSRLHSIKLMYIYKTVFLFYPNPNYVAHSGIYKQQEKKMFCLPFFSFNFTTQQQSTGYTMTFAHKTTTARTTTEKKTFKWQTNRLWTINLHCILYSSLLEQNRFKTNSNQIWHQITSGAPNPSTHTQTHTYIALKCTLSNIQLRCTLCFFVGS